MQKILKVEDYELMILQKSIKDQIKHIKACDFENEYKPLDFTREDVLEMLENINEKIWNCIRETQ